MADLHGVQDLNGWTFTFADNLVTQLKVDYRFTLMLENGVEIVIAEPFDLSDASGSEMVPPGETVYEVQAALPLFNQRVEQVRASSDGVLRVTFDGGSEIVVPTNHFENWQIVFPGGRMWIGSRVEASPSTPRVTHS